MAPEHTNARDTYMIPDFFHTNPILTLQTVHSAFCHIAKFATLYIEALTEFHAIEVKGNTMVRDNTKNSAHTDTNPKHSQKKRSHDSSSSNTQTGGQKRPKPSTNPKSGSAFTSYDEWKTVMLKKCRLCTDKKKSCFGCGRDVSNNKPQNPHNQKDCRAHHLPLFNPDKVPFHESKNGKKWITQHGDIHLCVEYQGNTDLSDPSIQLQIAYCSTK